ncbi:MAG TPA: MFS transporter [Candidatus Acidoferrum sp.]|nr:MFS transporter [Candidatus Acidoferrum sp.]
MTSSPSTVVRAKIPPAMLPVLILLALSAFINFVDRGNLSAAAPLLKTELSLSDPQLGILLAAFFWSYAVFQIASGWLVDHLDVKWMLSVGFFVWSVATAATGLAGSFALLLAARLVLGVGESVVYPSYSKILARYFPEDQRGVANSIIITGFYAGPAFGLFFGGILMGKYGWRSFFLVLGLLSLLWLVPWVRWMPRDHDQRSTVSSPQEETPGILEILKLRSAWGTCAALACLDYLSYFFLTWMPTYLVRGRNFSMDQMAGVMGAAYVVCALVAATCGWLSDRWIVGGATPTRVRKGFTSVGMAGAALFLLPGVFAGPKLASVMLVLVAASLGVSSSNVWAITQTLAGPRAAGRWTGIENFVGNLGGAVAPALTGFVLGRTGHYFWAFAITAVVSLLGALCWAFWIGRVEPVVWPSRSRVGAAPLPGIANR